MLKVKTETKTTITVSGDDKDNIKSALDKIGQEKIGFNTLNLNEAEVKVLQTLKDNLK